MIQIHFIHWTTQVKIHNTSTELRMLWKNVKVNRTKRFTWHSNQPEVRLSTIHGSPRMLYLSKFRLTRLKLLEGQKELFF